ncbi:MAG TPA: pseudouridine synthase [Acidimicrobiales bacterium]|nr:pseudouridine synthase [Acidimicrobiales bacterium]
MNDHEGERLSKVLARLGFGSRRLCDELIEDGRVVVNGDVAELGRRIDDAVDDVEVDGVPVGIRPGLVYYLLHKPAGVVTTAADTHGRPIVVDLVPSEPRVFPVGRLDADTEGLLILTNDGDLTHRLTHPSFGVDKEYLAHVEGAPSAATLARLRKGIELEDGVTAPAKASALDEGLVRIVIHEGRNRQVRRMLESVGHPVIRLVRTRIGSLVDAKLAPGEWRPLTPTEVRALAAEAGTGVPNPVV